MPDNLLTMRDLRSLSSPSVKNSKAPWLSILILSALALWLYSASLVSLVQQWWEDGNYSHGFFVPLIAGYILWRERGQRQWIIPQPNNYGFLIMGSAVGLMFLGTVGAEAFTTRFSLLVMISGLIVFLAGWQMMRSVAIPLGYLIFMIPLPALVYYQITFPLQILASRLGAAGLVALGIPTVREGNLLTLPNCTLEIVEACSGVRSLLSLLAAVVAYVYFAEPIVWKRLVLVASTIPIVILSNGVRLVATGVLSYRFGPDIDSGTPHLLLGVCSFLLALLCIFAFHTLLGFLSTPRRTMRGPA